jgi:hypothetical protein
MFMSGLVMAAVLTFVYRVYFFETKSQAELARDISDDLAKLQMKVQAIAHPASSPANGVKP